MNASWTYEEIGQEIGQLVDEKNAAYGSSFAKAGPFLRMLYGDSLRPEQYDFLLINARIFDKLMRAATNADAFGESPYRDIAGYALLAARMHEERKSRGCGSVSDISAAGLSMEPSASAAQPAPTPIATNADARSAKPSEPPSPKPHESTSRSTDAPAAERRWPANAVGPGDERVQNLVLQTLLRAEYSVDNAVLQGVVKSFFPEVDRETIRKEIGFLERHGYIRLVPPLSKGYSITAIGDDLMRVRSTKA